ncbi:MAG: type III pantothenate kinase [Verrucomicrobiae bacterium]|nr:type III pantothenate kinase [Verrucomicrobiae bacterium]
MKSSARLHLLIDIGNTNTHVGLSTGTRILRDMEFPTGTLPKEPIRKFLRGQNAAGVMVASVVPDANGPLKKTLLALGLPPPHFLSCHSPLPIGIRYPKPATIGADRLANAAGAVNRYGAPVIVIDFGTAVTFDIINSRAEYIGGIIAPGLAAMTHYLYERTALLPKISLREPRSFVGKSTVEAMTIGAVVGYRGLIREIITDVMKELKLRRITVVATGGYSALIARKIPAIQHVNPMLTLEGLQVVLNRI